MLVQMAKAEATCQSEDIFVHLPGYTAQRMSQVGGTTSVGRWTTSAIAKEGSEAWAVVAVYCQSASRKVRIESKKNKKKKDR